MKKHQCKLKLSWSDEEVINTREIAVEYRLSHWAGLIQERNESGLSIKAYCESIGLHQNVYHYWQRKLREAACAELLPIAERSGVPATVNGREVGKVPNGWAICESSKQPSSASGHEVIIEIGKSRVSANAGTDLELLGNVCRMLMSL